MARKAWRSHTQMTIADSFSQCLSWWFRGRDRRKDFVTPARFSAAVNSSPRSLRARSCAPLITRSRYSDWRSEARDCACSPRLGLSIGSQGQIREPQKLDVSARRLASPSRARPRLRRWTDHSARVDRRRVARGFPCAAREARGGARRANGPRGARRGPRPHDVTGGPPLSGRDCSRRPSADQGDPGCTKRPAARSPDGRGGALRGPRLRHGAEHPALPSGRTRCKPLFCDQSTAARGTRAPLRTCVAPRARARRAT